MPALTLVEAAKINDGNFLRQGITELYAGSSSVFQVLPFENILGNAMTYLEEVAYPNVGWRGTNEAYTASVGVLNPRVETLTIAGGEVKVDKFILKTMGEGQRAVHTNMQVRALALAWTNKFFNGDGSDPRELVGLASRVTGDQVISAGATAGGSALSLKKLDEAIDQCMNPTCLFMNKKMARKFAAAARSTTVGGNIQWMPDQLGQRVGFYDGLPMFTVDLDNNGDQILPFTEAADNGASTATSIYICNVGPMGLTGIQNGGFDVVDLGELQASPQFATRIEWYSGLAIFNGRAVVRLRHIGDLDIVA